MRIISYNVNGIRAAINKGFNEWLLAAAPDVLCLQETKATQDVVPTQAWEQMGYKHYWHSAQKKGYSGVALLCRTEPLHVEVGCGIDYIDQEGRVIRADFKDLSVISVYIPSGSSGDERQEVKMKFLTDFQVYLTELKKKFPRLVVCGDYNICHQPIDIHDPVRNATVSGFLPEEREWMSGFLATGWVDSFRQLNKEPHNYSWWTYRANARANNKGWRIDYNMVTEPLRDSITQVAILNQAKHSDHCPVLVELNP